MIDFKKKFSYIFLILSFLFRLFKKIQLSYIDPYSLYLKLANEEKSIGLLPIKKKVGNLVHF